MTTDSPPARPRLAAIDVGSNTIRLTVAEVESDGTYRILDEEREMVRLGEKVERTGRLSDEAVQRALAAIGKMKAIADGFEATEIRAIATSAVREASNGRAFCGEVLRRHKVRVDVISGDEEAQLAFRSATRHFNLDGRSSAVVDIGGGSVEVILTAGIIIDQIHSLPLGAVRLTERLVKSDPLRDKHWKQMRKEIDREIQSTIGRPPHRAEIMVGSGGTFTALAHMAKWQREGRHGSVQGYMLTPAELVHLLDQLREAPLEVRRQIPGLSPDRADIIVAGATVIARLVKRFGTQQILVNERGIRDGLLLLMISELQGRPTAAQLPQPADRMDWVRLFARKCRANERHCEHVAGLALQIFDGVKARYRLPSSARDVLQAAALLHDIGYLISHSKHHKHTYHLIMHGDLPAFSPHEVELIANVARYHRRAFPKKSHDNLTRLPGEERRLIGQLSGILRIADGLDRTHSRSVTGIRPRVLRNRLRLDIEASAAPVVERAGIHVVYGVVGLKTHCKASLVVRREAEGIRRYVHLSTGNYNPTTARVYTDLGLFTASPEFGEDVSELFNLLTGYSQGRRWRKLMIAPLGLLEQVVDLIERERRNAEAGLPSRIIVKMNALVEPSVIDALYRASQAGVSIELVIRGTCCLRPGIPGVSERIRVISVVDKFLEHSRVFYFENAGSPDVFLGSADWMPRNFFRRIEVMFPVEHPRLKSRLIDELLQVVLNDNVKARQLQSDGTYIRLSPPEGESGIRSQTIFQALARESAREAGEAVFRFVPIIGSLEGNGVQKPAAANGFGVPGHRSKPPRTRPPRARKRPESA